MTDSDERLKRLAGGVAHDFNNLLTSIKALSALALQELPEGHPTRPDLEEIERAANRAVALTRQLLAMAGRAGARPAPLDLNQTIATLEPALRAAAGPDRTLDVRAATGIPAVSVDARHVEQMLSNLVVNARDSAGPGGAVEITTAVDGGDAVITVRDSGPAEHGDDVANMLEPFWSTRSGRKLGLGLAAAAALARQAGGRIEVRGSASHAPAYEVRLPLPGQAAGTASGAAAADPAPAAPVQTILLCDDDASIRRLVQRILEGAGYRVLVATTPDEAIAHAERAGGAIDLLLTDVVMPGGGGHELRAALHARWPRVRALYMSGYTDDPAVRQEAGSQAGGYIQKPFGPDALLAAVRQMLAREP